MTMIDTNSRLTAVNALVPQTITDSALNTGNEDLFGFNGALIVVAPGSIEGLTGSPSPGSIAVKVEHSDDDGSGSPDSFANVAAVDIVGNSAAITSGVVHTFDEDNAGVFQCSYVGDKRWLKVTLTPTSLGAGGPIAVAIIKAHGRHQT